MNCHKGKCHMVDGQPRCICNPYYNGEFCETYMCSGYCLNGFCHPQKTADDEDQLQCICNLGYSGERCEINDQECREKCSNNSTCVSNPQTLELTCKCVPPFEGTGCDVCPGLQCRPGHCELDSTGRTRCVCPKGVSSPDCVEQKTCEGFQCANNSTCHLESGQPECRCLDNMYSGRMCELDKCLTIYCRNGGKGFRDNGQCRCLCKGYTGRKCETKLSDYIVCDGMGGTCANGGACTMMNNKQLCDCPPGYAGALCNIKLVGAPQLYPCSENICQNGGICAAVNSNGSSLQYVAECICDERYKGEHCQHLNKCFMHCMNGGTCVTDVKDGDNVFCHCPPAWYGSRCGLPYGDPGQREHSLDNTAINSLTVTIVSVSIVSVALVAILVYLLVFLLHRRRVTSPFKHRRMNDGSRPRSNNMEFANRMFLQDDDDISEEQGAFTMEELEPSTNFVNPVYETMFQDTRTPIIRPNADLSSFNNSVHQIPEHTGLLRSNEHAPPGRAVIHTDSD